MTGVTNDRDLAYAVTAWGQVHHYRLADGQLEYYCGPGDVRFVFDLRAGGFSVRLIRDFHERFQATVGLMGVLLVILITGLLVAWDRMETGLIGMFLGVTFGFGLPMLWFFRESYQACLLTMKSGFPVKIFYDRDTVAAAEQLVAGIRTYAG